MVGSQTTTAAAHMGTVFHKVPECQFVGSCDANPGCRTDPKLVSVVRRLDPQFFSSRQVPAVKGPVDPERFTESSRAPGKISQLVHTPPLLHVFDALQRLDRAYEDRAGDPFRFGNRIEADTSVNRIDVGVARRSEHGRIATRLAPVSMIGRVALGKISLHFYDPTRGHVVLDPTDQSHTQ